MTAPEKIKPRERDAIIQSLRAGVVPRSGHQHIQVGRIREVDALAGDLDRIADGGATARFVIGEFGSGKTFLLYLVRAMALHKRLVTVHADLTPDRRLHSTSGHGRALYAELMKNMATRSSADGGALSAVVERLVSSTLSDARDRGVNPSAVIQEKLQSLSEMVGGYDFACVIEAYWRGHDTGNDTLKSDAVRWLRAEFTAKTDARKALGVRTIIDDAEVYDHLKLMGRFVRLAGFSGLLVCVDEMVNLYKMANTRARSSNYEQVLRIVNDCLQGAAEGMGFLFGGTPDFLTDSRKGLYSYEALHSRLAENRFASNGLIDMSGPVVRLAGLTPEDMYVLLTRLRHVFAGGRPEAYLVPDEALQAFMRHCSQQVGDAYFRTPRNTVKEFLNLLSVLEQNPQVEWQALLSGVTLQEEQNPDLVPLEAVADDELTVLPQGERADGLTDFRL